MKNVPSLTSAAAPLTCRVLELLDVDGTRQFEVKSTNGDTHLGGEDFDQRVVDYCVPSSSAIKAIDLSKDARRCSACGSSPSGEDANCRVRAAPTSTYPSSRPTSRD
jgi:hypothetical protein